MATIRRFLRWLLQPDPKTWGYSREWHTYRELTPDEERKVAAIFDGADKLFDAADDLFETVNTTNRRQREARR